MIQIVEIIRRSEQGVTRPFICRADDDAIYYVKGAGAGWKALIAEWMAGHLGRHLGQPVPRFDLAEVPGSLLRYSSREDLSDLGKAPAFASREVPFAEELRFEQIADIPMERQALTLLFDCWSGNGDRTLSESGGNPNVLWTPADSQMHLIDHNLAFDGDPLAAIKEHHVFRNAATAWNADFRRRTTERMRAAMAETPLWWNSMPEEWLEFSDLSLHQVQEMLWRFDRPGDILWS